MFKSVVKPNKNNKTRLLVAPHTELHLRDLCGIIKIPAGLGMVAADVGLPGIGDRVYPGTARP